MQFFFPKFVILFSVSPTAINDFADELTETITNESTNSITITDVNIDDVADLTEDELDDYDEEIEEW